MLNISHFRYLVVRPTLTRMGMWSASAENLMLGTALQESRLHWLQQLPNGPALGLYQIEVDTMHDLLRRYLELREDIQERFEKALQTFTPTDIEWENVDDDVLRFRLIADLAFATAVARLRYWIVEEPLPDANDVIGLAHYWKRYYNTSAGKGTPQEFINNYNTYLLRSPVQLSKESKMGKTEFMALIRHILTFGGGYLASGSVNLTSSDVEIGVGAAMTLIGLIWSYFQKQGMAA